MFGLCRLRRYFLKRFLETSDLENKLLQMCMAPKILKVDIIMLYLFVRLFSIGL